MTPSDTTRSGTARSGNTRSGTSTPPKATRAQGDPSPPARDGAAALVKDLRKGDRVDRIFLVENSNFKQTRNNKHFIQADIRDRSGSIKAIRWEADRALFDSFRPSDFVHVAGRVEEFQQHLQIIVDRIEKVDDSDVDIELFLPCSENDIDELLAELEKRVAAIEDADYRRLLEAFLADGEIRRDLRRCPAGKTLHHAWIGGLLDHVVSLCRVAELVCSNYPRLNRDLLTAGIILHDIGKLRELSYDRVFRYSDAGQLVGHIALGIAWIDEMARNLGDFPPEKLTQLLHLIASHHGEPEYGAVKQPMTQEAVALHALDNLDAKLSMFETVEKEQRLGSYGDEDRDETWSDYHPALGRRLFFPRSSGSSGSSGS